MYGIRRLTVAALFLPVLSLIAGGRVRLTCLTMTRLAGYAAKVLAALSRGRFSWRCEGSHPWYSSATIFTDMTGRNIRHLADDRIMRMVGDAMDMVAARRDTDAAFRRGEGLEEVLQLYYEISLFYEVREHLFVGFALYAQKLRNELKPGIRLVMLVPVSWWCRFLAKELGELGLESRRVWHLAGVGTVVDACRMLFHGLLGRKEYLAGAVRRGVGLLRGMRRLWRGEIPFVMPEKSPVPHISLPYEDCAAPLRPAGNQDAGRVATVLYDGIAPTERSNIKWFWEEETRRDYLCVVAHANTVNLAPEILQLVRESGTRFCYDASSGDPVKDTDVWEPDADSVQAIFFEERQRLQSTVLRSLVSVEGSLRWLVSRSSELGYGLAWWTTYFRKTRLWCLWRTITTGMPLRGTWPCTPWAGSR